MTDYTDFDNDDEFLYGGIDEQTVEPQVAIEGEIMLNLENCTTLFQLQQYYFIIWKC
jgi:hypothetical protein